MDASTLEEDHLLKVAPSAAYHGAAGRAGCKNLQVSSAKLTYKIVLLYKSDSTIERPSASRAQAGNPKARASSSAQLCALRDPTTDTNCIKDINLTLVEPSQ